MTPRFLLRFDTLPNFVEIMHIKLTKLHTAPIDYASNYDENFRIEIN